MAFKFIVAFVFVAVASGGALPAAPLIKAVAPVAVAQPVLAKAAAAEEYDAYPQYQFGYDVQDSLSGDSKSQFETRDGDVVQGEYSLIDADGFKRTVQYTADPINGFNAVVHREPLVKAAPAAIKSVPLAYAAPAPLPYAAAPAVVRTAPLVYSAPAPLAYAAAPAIVKTAPLTYASPAFA